MTPAFWTFIIVTSLTPGPNNVACASLGMASGYRGAFPFALGVFNGLIVMLTVIGLSTETVIAVFPGARLFLAVAAVAYLGWLGIGILRMPAMREFHAGRGGTTSFRATWLRGTVLQVVNPKAYVFCITAFAGYLHEALDTWWQIFGAAIITAFVPFVNASIWALAGAGIGRFLSDRRAFVAFKVAMALLLWYSAVGIVLELF